MKTSFLSMCNTLRNKNIIPSGIHILILLFVTISSPASGFIDELKIQGFSLIPAPQKTELTGQQIIIDHSWGVDSKLDANSIVLNTLKTGAIEFHSLAFSGNGDGRIIFEVQSGSVGNDLSPELAEQAYRLEIAPEEIKVTANAEAGLFYGVQSLLQLLKPLNNGTFSLPEGTITDWPSTGFCR